MSKNNLLILNITPKISFCSFFLLHFFYITMHSFIFSIVELLLCMILARSAIESLLLLIYVAFYVVRTSCTTSSSSIIILNNNKYLKKHAMSSDIMSQNCLGFPWAMKFWYKMYVQIWIGIKISEMSFDSCCLRFSSIKRFILVSPKPDRIGA